MDYLKNKRYYLKHIIVIPLLSILSIPILITDIFAELYHRISFPLCNIRYIQRKKYIKIDRFKLTKLTLFQKIYCIYCGYVNGLINYWKEMAAQTEKYWCGIKHKKDPNFLEQEHHKRLNFIEYKMKK